MLIDHIDGANRLIYLSIETVNTSIHPIDIYKEMRTLRRTIEELRQYDVFLKAYGNVDKGGGKSTERYVQTIQNTKIIPWDATQEITITGTIITDDGQEGIAVFDRTSLSPGVEVDINYVPPQVEIITISTGGATPQSLWEYSDRTLTSGAASGDVNVVSINSVPVTSPDDFKADLSLVPQEVWEYVSRTIQFTPEQEAKFDQILLDIADEATSIRNTTIATS